MARDRLAALRARVNSYHLVYVIIFTIPHSQAQRQGGPQSSNATGDYEMAGIQSQDRITDGNGANAGDGMTRFYNQVRHPIFRYFILCEPVYPYLRSPIYKTNFGVLMQTCRAFPICTIVL